MKGSGRMVSFRSTRASAVVIYAALFLMLSTAIFPGQVMAGYGEGLLKWGSSGEEVRSLQKDLSSIGYDTIGVDGIFGPNTYNAVVKFQKGLGLIQDGIVGPQTKSALSNALTGSFKYQIKWGDTLSGIAQQYGTTVSAIMNLNKLSSNIIYAGSTILIPRSANTSVNEPSRGENRYGEMADWWTTASKVFAIGDIATITDLDSGLTYRVKRTGGSKHADCQPVTSQDTANMLKAYGGQWAWTRHAILVNIDGRVLAASQNAMPHGGQSIYNNNFPGHFCIHFLNSRTHGTDNLDPAHQSMVRKAAGQAY